MISKEKGEQSFRDIWNNNRQANVHIIKFPEGEKKKSGNEKLSKEMIKTSQFGEKHKPNNLKN